MAKTSRNKKSKSENILELLYRLKERNLLEDLGKDLDKRKGAEVFKSTFKLFKEFVENELPIEKVPSDAELGKRLKQTELQFNTTRRDFYKRILNFAGRTVLNKEEWYEQMLEILSEVDALWELKLYDQAEMRFIDIYKIYPTDKNLQFNEYNYGLSKLAYYGVTFFAWKSYLGIADTHKKFFKKEQFQLIREIEMNARQFDVGKASYGNADEWPLHQAMFRFHNLLAAISKQKKEFADARENLQKVEDNYSRLAAAFHFRGQNGKRIFNFFSNHEPQEADDIETAFYFYLKLEAFRLSLLDGDHFQAQQILHELYGKLNENFEKSRNNWATIIIFLKSELEKATYAVPFTAEIIEEKKKSFSSSFLASKKEITSLMLRLEVNFLTYEFFVSPEIPSYEKIQADIKDLETRLKGIAEVRLDLLMIKLLICFESQRYDKIQETVRSLNVAMDESKRSTKLLRKFVIRFSKLNHQNQNETIKEIAKMLLEMEPLRNYENHLDNLIVFWMKQFGSRRTKR